MGKDEILEMKRSEKFDEGKDYILKQGRSTGVVAMTLVFFLLAIYNIIEKQTKVNEALCSIFFIYLAFEALGTYRCEKKVSYLIKFAVSILISLVTASR